MTIALGILASDGVVIAADREETIEGLAKYEENKIRGVHHHQVSAGSHRHLLLAGAGWADYIDAFAETLQEDEILKDPRCDLAPRLVLDEALERFWLRKIAPFNSLPQPDRPSFQVVIAYTGGGRSHLFVSNHNVLKRQERFAVIGSGDLVARPILHRFMPPDRGSGSISVREAVVVAAHAVREAKDAVPGVGKDTDILALFQRGKLARTVPPTQEPLDRVLQWYSGTVEPMAVRAIIGTRDPKSVLVEIKKLRAAVATILGDTFAPPSAAPVSPHQADRSRRPRTKRDR